MKPLTPRLKIKQFQQLVRLPNLLIVAFTQFLIQYAVLVPNFSAAHLSPALPPLQFILFVCSTVLIAATGYIINDILDADIDRINKPNRLIITKYLTKDRAWQLYFLLTLIGFFISLYLALFIENLPLVFIYPAAVSLLAAYSFYLKKMPLAGNLVVALFCAFVPGVVLFAERATYFNLQTIDYQLFTHTTLVIGSYIIFAFLSTLFREIVKDMEDITGDLRYGCRTLPIVIGIKKTKWVALITGGIFFSFLIKITHVFYLQWMVAAGFNLFFIALPLFLLLVYLLRGTTPIHFRQVSTATKVLMLNGLLLLIILAFFY